MKFETILPKNLHYAYVIVVNIIRTLFFIAVLDQVYASFEVIVVSFLILLYVTITNGFHAHGLELLNQNLLIAMGIQEKSESDQEALEEQHQKLQFEKKKFYIRGIANFIIYLIVIIAILNTL